MMKTWPSVVIQLTSLYEETLASESNMTTLLNKPQSLYHHICLYKLPHKIKRCWYFRQCTDIQILRLKILHSYLKVKVYGTDCTTITSWTIEISIYHIWARTCWGTPDWRKTSLISGPDTNPSLSMSVCRNSVSYLARSSAVTTQGVWGTGGTTGCKWYRLH